MTPVTLSSADRRLITTYIVTDFCLSLLAIVLFQIIRYYLEFYFADFDATLGGFLRFSTIKIEIAGMPVVMVLAFWLTGFYSPHALVKSRLGIVSNTLLVACVLSLLFFSTAVINDLLPRRRYAYFLCVVMTVLFTVLPLVGRLVISHKATRRFKRGGWRRAAAVMGCGHESVALARRIERDGSASWFSVEFFIAAECEDASRHLHKPLLSMVQLEEAIAHGKVKAIIVPPGFPSDQMLRMLNDLYKLPVEMYAAPALGNPATPVPRFSDVNNEPLVNILKVRIHPGVANMKRVSDIVVAATSLILLAPLLAVVAIGVRFSSPGPVFYRQERLGRYRKPFKILKFRTMTTDAEVAGPMLSSGNSDPRITPLGRFLRKYRIDELPNLWNVLRGDMSLVGPRPERPFYIDQITRVAPAYSLLFNIRPGITSWGMVRFGYAQNVDEMIERMRYDLLYIENISFGVDLKILLHTISTIINGKGK